MCCRLIFCLAAVLVLLPFSVVVRAEEGAEEAPAEAENEARAAIDDGKPMQATVEILVLEYANNTMFDLGTSGIYTRRDEGSTGPGILSMADLVFPSFSSGGLGLGMLLDNISIGEGEFQFVIQALERDENLEILSRPTLLLERGGQEASYVQTVDKVPYETNKVVGTTVVKPTDFKDAGVRLAVRLADIHEVGPGEYYLDLELDTGVRAVGPRLPVAHAEPPEGAVIEVPEFFSRSIKTKVAVRDRQILVIGALLSKEKYNSERKLPILGNIPVLKYLFSSRREEERYRELIFFVRPRVDLGGYVQQPSFPDDTLGSGDEQ
jgi:type II secretory pathway component GspD/PulD (secretin)